MFGPLSRNLLFSLVLVKLSGLLLDDRQNVSLPLIAHVILSDRVGRLILGLAPAKLRGRKVWVARPVHRISCIVSPHSYTSGSCGPLLWLQIACDEGGASAAIALRLVTTTLYVN